MSLSLLVGRSVADNKKEGPRALNRSPESRHMSR